ncbi:hypothetical protein V2H45_14260 [Tumidithrix elongata RA019]|uniref:Uncharacterized protein n=1 Tax=Tumidithrix elongata BACA0141 TaxID=2716417 RepID=A0AAW9Q4Q8_9CYAN|nr:hypothetical protein [Tumidithrix elongata RA019]
MEIELDTDHNPDRNIDQNHGQAGQNVDQSDRHAQNQDLPPEQIDRTQDSRSDLGIIRPDRRADRDPSVPPIYLPSHHPSLNQAQTKIQRTESLFEREIKRVRAQKERLNQSKSNAPPPLKPNPKPNLQPDLNRDRKRKSELNPHLRADLVPYQPPNQKPPLALYEEPEQKPKPKPKKSAPSGYIGWADLFVILSIPAIGCSIWLGTQFLSNPLSMSWLYSTQAPIFTPSLWNQPKTLAQIKAELAESQLSLGDSLDLKTGEQIYAVIQSENKTIREIRLYHPISDRGREKLVLITSIQTPGLENSFVKGPFVKYRSAEVSTRDNYNRLPLTNLKAIVGGAPNQGIWFVAYGKNDDATYGQVFNYTPNPQPTMVALKDWVSPLGEFPKWQVALSGGDGKQGDSEQEIPPKPQLVINQSIDFEPNYLIFQVEDNISTETKSYIQLRQVTLNEALGLPSSYSDALTLASSGLWSSALAKLNELKLQFQAKGKIFSPYVQEQYDLIALHATLSASQANQPFGNFGDKVLVKIIDGRWQEALDMVQSTDSSAEKIAAMLAKYDAHIWMRVQTALKLESSPAVKVWGGLVVLNRQGLRQAERWLKEQSADSKAVLALLQKLDLTPIALNPQQLLGTVSYLGKGSPGGQWQLPPPELLTGQAWYTIDLAIVRDGDIWKNAPFPELADRSSLFVWKVLGLEQNNRLGIAVADNAGELLTASLLAQSFSIDGYGNIRVLATGSADLAKSLNKGSVPTLVTTGGTISDFKGQTVYLPALSPETATSITNTLYREIGKLGQVSLDLKDFSQQLQQWSFQLIDTDGDNKPEYLLEVERSQIDFGDRHYPMVAVFSSTGRLIFSDIGNRARRWIGVLPSKVGGQILTEINGYYEVWSLR